MAAMSMAQLLVGIVLLIIRIAVATPEGGLPSYHYGAPIHVECMNRSS
jgi:hypothetical protein